MTSNNKRLFLLLLTILATSLFCVSLYRFNNKNTYTDVQPDCGQLSITIESLQDIFYLVEDWEFYPDQLLTPDELSSHAKDQYMVYTDIGDSTRFDYLETREDPHGCGTYAMHLWLPEGEHTYSLELPEIYSAYRLYINGVEYLQVGNPDPNAYLPRTQAKVVTFRADTRADLIIAVSDYSHYYSGIVYAPAFGLAENISLHRDLRLVLSMSVVSTSILLTAFAFYLGIRLRKENAILFALLNFDMGLVLAFPALHILIELPVFPWYALELSCIYLMIHLVFILHNRICTPTPAVSLFSVSASILFLIIASCYGLSAPYLTVTAMRFFSRVLAYYKLGIASYLLITAFLSIRDGNIKAAPVLYATVAYAFAYVWDRILPAYDPIYLGYFSDWGNFFLVAAIGYCMFSDVASTYIRSIFFREEHRQITRQLTMQNEYTRQLTEHVEQNRRLIHDFRHHLRTIQTMADALPDQADNLRAYVYDLSKSTHIKSHETMVSFSSDPAVDALLRYYYAFACKHQINTDFQLLPLNTTLTDVELCTVLGNLLENAIEACRYLPDDTEKTIRLHSLETEHMLFIRIENTYDGMIRRDDGTHHYLSRKTEDFRYGIGMDSVREITRRHGGTLDVYPKEKIFRVGISLPLAKESK